MVSMKNVFFVLAAIFCLALQSCNSEDQLRDIENTVSVSEQEEEKQDGMFSVSFVNPDGTPYVFNDNLTKVTWGGGYSTYPYGTEVTTNWSTFCSGGETVELNGGDGGKATLSSSSGSYTIASSIDKNYNISVSVIPAPVTTYTISLSIKTTGIEVGKPVTLTIYNNGTKVYNSSITSGNSSTSFKVDKGSSVSLSATCNYGVSFSQESFSNVTSDKSVTVWVNY